MKNEFIGLVDKFIGTLEDQLEINKSLIGRIESLELEIKNLRTFLNL